MSNIGPQSKISTQYTTVLTGRELREIFRRDERITEIRVYLDGWLAGRYHDSYGRMVRVQRGGERIEERYDMRRSHGVGPRWVAVSAKGGRLASA